MRYFVSIKAFGDCIIAINNLRSYGQPRDVLLCGSHLRSLIKAIGYEGNVEWLETAEFGVPAIFNIRQSGVLRAVASGIYINKIINKIVVQDDLLLYDKLGWREILLSGFKPMAQIYNGHYNIYSEYKFFLTGKPALKINYTKRVVKKIGIFPGSRVLVKQLDDILVSNICLKLSGIGCETQVFYIGEKLINYIENSVVIDGFDELIECIRGVDVVVSADSLPAHIAEYLNIPVFVFSPVLNDYWLPQSAYFNDGSALFGDVGKCISWVENFNQIGSFK